MKKTPIRPERVKEKQMKPVRLSSGAVKLISHTALPSDSVAHTTDKITANDVKHFAPFPSALDPPTFLVMTSCPYSSRNLIFQTMSSFHSRNKRVILYYSYTITHRKNPRFYRCPTSSMYIRIMYLDDT